jgi:hypothetical protein
MHIQRHSAMLIVLIVCFILFVLCTHCSYAVRRDGPVRRLQG